VGGERAYPFRIQWHSSCRKEPGRSRDSPVTLLHCSIRTRRIGTALATRRAQRGSPAQGWRVRTAAGIRPADPFLVWIRGSVPQVQPRPCGTVSDRFGEHPCAGEGQLGHRFPGVASRTGQPRISAGRRVALCAGLSAGSPALHRAAVACRCALPRNRSREDRKTSLQPARSPGRAPVSAGRTSNAAPRFSVRPRGRMPGGVFTCNYYHFARLCAPVRAMVGADISWCALSHPRQFGSNYEMLANFSLSAGLESKTGLQLSIFQLFA